MKISQDGWKKEEKSMKPDTKKSYNKKKKLKNNKKNNKRLISRNTCSNKWTKNQSKKLMINKNIIPRLKYGKKITKNSKNSNKEKLFKNNKS